MNKTIVIVGGGFAGAYLARDLERSLPREWNLVLFSEENFLTFTPLLAEVVGSSIEPHHALPDCHGNQTLLRRAPDRVPPS
jgi:NADH dehydrogenase